MAYERELRAAIDVVESSMRICVNVRAELEEKRITKTDSSPVTVADFSVQAHIGRTLHDAFPSDEFVAEETSGQLREPSCRAVLDHIVCEVNRVRPGAELSEEEILGAIDRGGGAGGPAGRHWVLDPIDGTKGFICPGDHFVVGLGLIENGRAVLGVMGCPSLVPGGCILYAVAGQGCRVRYLADGRDEAVRTREDAGVQDALFISGDSDPWFKGSRVARLFEGPAGELPPSERLCCGSLIKYAAVALGQASVFYIIPTRPRNQLKIWDHVAGLVCVLEAGGYVSDVAGAVPDLSLGRTFPFETGIICSANRGLHALVLSAFGAFDPTIPPSPLPPQA